MQNSVTLPTQPAKQSEQFKYLHNLYMKCRAATPFLRHARARWALAFAARPLDRKYGRGRGLPFPRYYIDQFHAAYREDIRGHVLEFMADHYTSRFAVPGAVTKLDIMHIDDTNPRATIIADLTEDNDVPSETYDCIVCTCTLNVTPYPRRMLKSLHRILKPGGILLATTPGVGMVNYDLSECWRFTLNSLLSVLHEAFSDKELTLESHGNSLVAAAAVRGLAVPDLPLSALKEDDELFPVMLCARVVKAGS